MKADFIGYLVKSFYANAEVSPEGQYYQWISRSNSATVDVLVRIVSIGASASDVSIPIDDPTNVVATFFWDTAGAAATDLTIKTNSDSDARAVKPIRALSEKVTTLTVSNSASETKYLGIATVYVSDTTNTELKELNYNV